VKRLLAIAFLVGACRAGGGGGSDAPSVPTFDAFSPASFVPGTRLVLKGTGFRSSDDITVHFVGRRSGATDVDVDVVAKPVIDDTTRLFVDVDARLLAQVGEGRLAGHLRVDVERDGRRTGLARPAELEFARTLTPKFAGPGNASVAFGEPLKLSASGLLLGSNDALVEGVNEGRLEVVADGRFTYPDGTQLDLVGYPMPVVPSSRTEGVYLHTPDVFGLQTGTFDGSLTPVNRHAGGTDVKGEPMGFHLEVARTAIVSMDRTRASREERVGLAGFGFYASERDGTTCSIHLEGEWTPAGASSEPMDLVLPVRVAAFDRATWVMHPERAGDGLVGLGSTPGRFTGSVTPRLDFDGESLYGEAWSGSFDVLPTKQVVQLRFTPQFTEALRLFGLRNVEAALKARVFEVARRDYAPYFVEFRAEVPADFDQFTTLELTGDDPNDFDLFGLDNTDGKDEGNLRLEDYVGGANVEQAAAGSFAYGGVFLASFLRLSPNVCRRVENGSPTYLACNGKSQFPLRNPRFDDVFRSFAPILGGSEARADELDGGPRQAALLEAVRVLGSLAGNTVVHELGHSLGLAQDVGPDGFHNSGDEPGLIMNPGAMRSFEERAELDGKGPAHWSPRDAAYLRQVLPRP
jgi:hypothetical protein